jgi:hypothetical protein
VLLVLKVLQVLLALDPLVLPVLPDNEVRQVFRENKELLVLQEPLV